MLYTWEGRVSREMGTPRVSVLMPTYNQAGFIRRALGSLLAQTVADWELIIVDDGSRDETAALVAPYLADPRVRYERHARNLGLGAALNRATALARGRYLAYLPSDDVYYPHHLHRLLAVLDTQPDVYLAYGGVRWQTGQRTTPTLQGTTAVGREAEALVTPPEATQGPPSGNLLALVQVLHRRAHEPTLRWPTRAEVVTDRLERDFWHALIRRGRFAYADAITAEWVAHPEQHSQIVSGHKGGLSRYRRYYGIGRGELLNFQPSSGMWVNEQARYSGLLERRELPAADGLKILMVGTLGFNPERIMAFEERGHKLYGLWWPRALTWDTVGPLSFGNVEDIPYDQHWVERVREIQPDVIYGLLNWHALTQMCEVLDADFDCPFVFHFKEGPMRAHHYGLWPALVEVLTRSDAQVFISPENREWYQLALDGALDLDRTLILDGDPPRMSWMTDDWSPKLSASDGEIHTVCSGRPIGIEPFADVAAAGIHIHFYGECFHGWFPDWVQQGISTGYMHLHSTVEPVDWVRELSQYDAGWFHIRPSSNDGDLRGARWDDLNLPARLGTYAAAGLPWIMRDNRPSHVTLQRIAQEHDVGLYFRTFADLGQQLRDRARLAELTANMRAVRHQFAFDTHVDALIALFRATIERRRGSIA